MSWLGRMASKVANAAGSVARAAQKAVAGTLKAAGNLASRIPIVGGVIGGVLNGAGTLIGSAFGAGSAGNSIKLKDVAAAYKFPGIVDIVRDYKWHTGVEVDMPVSHIPRIILREYELANSALYAQATRKLSLGKLIGDNPYAAMYTCTATGHTYILPYLTDTVWSVDETWEPVDAGGNSGKDNGAGGLVGAIGGVINFFGSAVGAISDTVNQVTNAAPAKVENNGMQWTTNESEDVTTKFYLINTNATPQTWIKNYNFCQYLIVSCLHDQMNTTKAVPPPIYTMYIPGMRYSPACAISKLSIKQIGSVMTYSALGAAGGTGAPSPGTGAFNPENDVIYIPDAWEIEISFCDLVMPSRQTHLYGMNPARRKDFQAITPAGSNAPLDTCVYTDRELLSTGKEDNAPGYETRSGAALFDLNDINQITGVVKDDTTNQADIPWKDGRLLDD